MEKAKAIKFFGSAEHLAIAVGLSAAGVSTWPEVLPPKTADRVIGAAVRTEGVKRTRKAFPDAIND